MGIIPVTGMEEWLEYLDFGAVWERVWNLGILEAGWTGKLVYISCCRSVVLL